MDRSKEKRLLSTLIGRCLHHGIKVKVTDERAKDEVQTPLSLDSDDRIELLAKDGSTFKLGVWQVKPYLFKLDYLKDLVRTNGKTFVPIDELRKFCSTLDESGDYFGDYFPLSHMERVRNLLDEWHFDTSDNLIKNNLAIDAAIWSPYYDEYRPKPDLAFNDNWEPPF